MKTGDIMQLVPELKDSLFNDNVKDIGMDISELIIDNAMNEGVLKEIPIIKSIVAFCKTGMAIRERNLLMQTIAFIQGLNEKNISQEKKEKYLNRLSNIDIAEKELGRVLYLLDSQIENIQSKILGRMYFAYVEEEINWNKFCELAEANRRMFVSDYDVLLRLSKNRTSEQLLDNNNKYIVGRLIGLGLMVEKESPTAERTLVEKLNRDTKYGGNSELKGIFRRFNNDYQITSFGKSFLIFLVEQSGI
jgi:hypothetical protein